MGQPDLTEKRMRTAYPFRVDMSNCDVEPLHHIGLVQQGSCIVAADAATMQTLVISENAIDFTGHGWDELIDAPLEKALGSETVALIARGISRNSFDGINPISHYATLNGQSQHMYAVAYLDESRVVIELETAHSKVHHLTVQRRLGGAIQRIQSLTNYNTMFAETAKILKEVTGYDRVMVYRFDKDFNGEVIAEAKEAELGTFLDLRYPSTDIPKQARDLYKRNQIRMLSDVHSEQIQLRKSTHLPANVYIDLSLATGRGVSPIHQEYLLNMGVAATMSIAIILNGELWGLFAMHHHKPKFVEFELRQFLVFVGQVFSGHLALQAASNYRERALKLNYMRNKLTDRLADTDDVLAGLMGDNPSLLSVMEGSTGVAASLDDELLLKGDVPTEQQVRALAQWAAKRTDDPLIYKHDRVCEDYPEAENFCSVAAGVLLIWLDGVKESFIIWFRPEIIQTVAWGGNPDKTSTSTADGQLRLSPRKSFEKYSQSVSQRSAPWTQLNEDAALFLRSHFKDVIMQRYQHVRQANDELSAAYRDMEAFSYTISHDLRAPLRSISGFAEILLEDYIDKLDDDAIMMLRSIEKSSALMNNFINELLELSKVGTANLDLEEINLSNAVISKFDELRPLFRKRQVELVIADGLPKAKADSRLLNVILNNLLGNAIKYTLDEEVARIELGVRDEAYQDGRPVYFVRDNGIGFDQQFADRAFEMFSRLTDDLRIEGSGVGLALVQRAIERHNGAIWAEAHPGQGATFYFTLSK